MILSSVTCCFLVLVYMTAAVKMDLREACGSNNLRCTISNCNDDQLVIDNTASRYNFSELVFQNCKLPSIPSLIFSSTPKLERLLMYKCGITSLDGKKFNGADNLRSLYLPNNRLTELAEKVFTKLTSIEEIRLANNHISHIHAKAFVGLSRLRVLELNNNKIHEFTSGVFSNLTNLEYIDISYNDIETIDEKTFQMNVNLKTILMSNNNFVIFDRHSLAHLSHLNMLDISNNVIPSIRLQSVVTLRAQNAHLQICVIDGSVIRIRACNNQLKTISIGDKSSVKEIDVHSNEFETLSDFNGMLNLQKLNVSKNPIRSLNTSNTSLLLDLPSLQYLNLAYGRLQYLLEENFLLLGKLTHLDLAYNNLGDLDARVIEPIAGLEKIYIEGNSLHSFEYETFLRNHASIREMGLFMNEWSQSYLKKMSDVLKANDIKLVVRFNPNEGSEMLSLQTLNHPHHTIHAKTLEHGKATPTGVNYRDVLIIITLCLVLLILCLQLGRILKEENVFTLFNQSIHRTVRSRRLDEEESEPL